MSTAHLPARARARVLDEALAPIARHPQVAAVFTRAADRGRTPSPVGAARRLDPDRARPRLVRSAALGRFLSSLLKPRITPIADAGSGYVATHGSAWDYDRRVPILFWRRGMTPLRAAACRSRRSTSCRRWPRLIGLPLAPGSVDGRCLDLVAGPETHRSNETRIRLSLHIAFPRRRPGPRARRLPGLGTIACKAFGSWTPGLRRGTSQADRIRVLGSELERLVPAMGPSMSRLDNLPAIVMCRHPD